MNRNVLDLNSEKKRVVLLIHPMLSSAEGMKRIIAERMGSEFRYIIPNLSAHGNAEDKRYVSAEKESEKIYDYLKINHIEELALAFGASLGGVVLLQLLNHKDVKIDKVLFEGCSVWQNASVLEWIVRNVFIHEHRKAVHNRESTIKKMKGIYGNGAAAMVDGLIAINEQSIRNICRDCAFVRLPVLSEEEQQKCLFLYGSKDVDLKGAKRILPKRFPHAKLKVWQGYGHCMKITADTSAYCEMLKREMEI